MNVGSQIRICLDDTHRIIAFIGLQPSVIFMAIWEPLDVPKHASHTEDRQLVGGIAGNVLSVVKGPNMSDVYVSSGEEARGISDVPAGRGRDINSTPEPHALSVQGYTLHISSSLGARMCLPCSPFHEFTLELECLLERATNCTAHITRIAIAELEVSLGIP